MSFHSSLSVSKIPPPLSKNLSRTQSRRDENSKGSETKQGDVTSLIKLNFRDELFPAEQLQSSENPNLETTDIPEPSNEAIKFLNSLDADHLSPLIFNEQLVTTSENGDLGEFVISIEESMFQHEECYLIIAKSLGYVEGVLCGTSFTAYVNSQLQTLEQRHHEFVKVSPIPLDRKSLLVKKNGIYVYTKILTNGNETTRFQKAWRVSDVPALILEGANILLVRALIHRKHIPADFQVASIDSDGEICKSDYNDLGASVKEICNTFVPVIGIQRSIYSKDNSISWRYFLTTEAYLLIRQQVGSPVIMKVTKIPSKLEKKGEEAAENLFKKQPLEWEKDMEMKSKFIDKKSKYMNNFSGYLRRKPEDDIDSAFQLYLQNRPELEKLIFDFMQYLLLNKPDDVFLSAAEFFSSHST